MNPGAIRGFLLKSHLTGSPELARIGSDELDPFLSSHDLLISKALTSALESRNIIGVPDKLINSLSDRSAELASRVNREVGSRKFFIL